MNPIGAILLGGASILVPWIGDVRATQNDMKLAKLQGFDVVAPPERAVTLCAKLERKGILGINPDVHGEEVLFFLGEREIGRAKTGHDGLAMLSWTPPGFGKEAVREHEFRVALAPDSRYLPPAAILRVFVRDRERPAIVIDLDGTLCMASGLEVAMKPPSELKACEGSSAALHELAPSYDVIYLTGRDDALAARTREWLDLHGFPHGPVLVRDIGLLSASAMRYKMGRLRSLKRDFHLVAGVGDRSEDALAYLDAGLIAILIGDEADVPKGARKLVHWSEVVKLLRP